MSKRLNRLRPNFVWDLTGPQGRFMDAQNYKKLYLKKLDFCEILKVREKIFENSRTFLFLLYIVQREDAHR